MPIRDGGKLVETFTVLPLQFLFISYRWKRPNAVDFLLAYLNQFYLDEMVFEISRSTRPMNVTEVCGLDSKQFISGVPDKFERALITRKISYGVL